MTIMKSLSAAIAASVMIGAPIASAQAAQAGQAMTAAEARVQMQQYCADAARRTDDAGRTWHATYCTPAAMARYGEPAVGSAATVAGVGFMLAALLIGIMTAD